VVEISQSVWEADLEIFGSFAAAARRAAKRLRTPCDHK